MKSALARFDAGLEEVKDVLAAIAFKLDRLPDDIDMPELCAELDRTIMEISDASALLDAKRVIFYHEANAVRG
jgi:hypothetical protein